MPLNIRSNVLAVALLASLSLPAFAAPTVVVNETTATTNTANHPVTVTVQLDPNTIAGFDFEVSYDTTHLTADSPDVVVSDPTGAGAGVTCIIGAPGTLTCFAVHPTATYPGNVTVTVQFDVGGTEVPAPGTPLTVTSTNFADNNGNTVSTDPAPTDGAVVITGAPVVTPPTISGTFNPTVPANPFVGTTRVVGTVDFEITSPAANGGTGSVTCVDDAGGATLTFNPATQNGLTTSVQDVQVSCAITNAAQTGDFTCTSVNGGSQTFTATCPAGTAAPVPTNAILVPANSLWSKLGLAALLAALGVVFVAIRRNH